MEFKTITERVKTIQQIAQDAHERLCLLDADECWQCQAVYDETLVAEVNDIHKIASAENL